MKSVMTFSALCRLPSAFWRFAKSLDVKTMLFSHNDDWPHLCLVLDEVEEEFTRILPQRHAPLR